MVYYYNSVLVESSTTWTCWNTTLAPGGFGLETFSTRQDYRHGEFSFLRDNGETSSAGICWVWKPMGRQASWFLSISHTFVQLPVMQARGQLSRRTKQSSYRRESRRFFSLNIIDKTPGLKITTLETSHCYSKIAWCMQQWPVRLPQLLMTPIIIGGYTGIPGNAMRPALLYQQEN